MTGPEAGSGPDPAEPFHAAVDTTELEAARAKLGRERTHAATSWRDKEGITQLDHDPTKFDGDPYSTTPSERMYWAEMRQSVREGAQELKDNGATPEEIQAYVRDGIMNELMQRMQAEVDAKTNPDTIRGQIKAKAVNWIRQHGKLRIALGVGLTVAAGAAVATGVGGVAIGLVAGRAALSGAGAYVGLKDLQEVGGNSFNHREGRWWNFGKKGKMATVSQEQVDAMNADQRLQHMTQLLAAKARTGRNPEQTENDDKALKMLLQKEREEIDARLEDQEQTHFGANLLRGAMKVLDGRVTEQLAVERKQLVHDKHVHRRRTFVAGTLATGIAGYGLVAGIAQDGITLGHHAAEAVHHAAGSHGAVHGAAVEHGGHHAAHAASHHGGAEAHTNVADHATHVTETHPSSFEHYPEIITDNVNQGDTPYKVALKHLTRIQGWSHFSPAEQHEKAMHFANQLVRAGDHWRYTKEVIRASYNFGPGTAAAEHAGAGFGHGLTPAYEHMVPSNEADHVLPNGGVAAPDTHEFALAPHGGELWSSSFAHYPEIVTKPVRMGDSILSVARDQLGHIQGWNHFSAAEQHLKATHLANQLVRDGDHWRYTKEAIQASFNVK
jgi:hypothetical protein